MKALFFFSSIQKLRKHNSHNCTLHSYAHTPLANNSRLYNYTIIYTLTTSNNNNKKSMAERLSQITSHFTSHKHKGTVPTKIGVKSPDDVVIVDAVRTAITRGNKGGFKDTVP